MRRLTAALLIALLLTPSGVAPVLAQDPPSNPPQQPPVNPRQAPPPPPEPQQRETVLRAFADLVLVDVQITDRDGKPIKGLKPEQFEILEDGKAQKVTSFDYYDIETIETAAAENQQPVVVALGTVAPPDEVRQMVRDRRMIVLFFDLTSMQPDELLRSHEAGVRYLNEQMTPADLVGIVAFGNRLSVLANFTNNREFLLAAMNRIRPGKDSQLAEMAETGGEEGEDVGNAFTADETEFNIFNTDRKLAALQGIAELLRGIPGKKAVIHFTGGVTQTGQENRSQLRAATDAANRSNVSFYTVDARGLQAAIPGGEARTGGQGGTSMFSGASVFRQVSSRQDSRETLDTLASDTGGRSFFDIGDFKEVFDRVQQDGAGYYLVGYYTSNPQRDGRWRDVKVRVAGVSGARLRHREGYYAPKEFGRYTTEDRERHLDEAMRSEAPRVDIALVVETNQFRIGANEVFVPVAAKLASSALEWAEKRGRRETEFDFAAEVREETSGVVVAALRDTVKVRLEEERFQQVQQRAIVYQGGVILGPGEYRLKFLARENESGRVGTFELPVSIARPEASRIEISSLLLSSQVEPVQRRSNEVQTRALARDARLQKSPLEVGGERVIPSVTRVFTTQQRLFIVFQAYLPEKVDAANVRAGLIFFRDGEKVSESPMLVPAEVDARTRTAAFRMSLPLERFAAGRYVVQAVVIEAGGAHSGFARNYFALRPPVQAAAAARPGE